MNESYFRIKEDKKLRILFLLMLFTVVVALGFIFRYYFWPFIMAIMFYFGLKPLHGFLLRVVRKRALSSLLVLVLLFNIFIVPLFFLLLSLADQTYQLYLYIQDNLDRFSDILNHERVLMVLKYFDITQAEAIQKITQVVKSASLEVFGHLTPIVSLPLQLAVSFFFMMLMLYFLLNDAHRLEESFYRYMPFPRDIEQTVVERLKSAVKILIAGNLLISFLQGLMLGIGLFLAGIQVPIVWGSVGAILSLIPVIGTSLIWVPAVAYLVMSGSYGMAVFLGSWSLFWYLFLENFVKPKVFGDRLHFHPLIIFFLLLGSIKTLGLIGVIIGPLLLTLFYSLWDIYVLIFISEPEKELPVR